MYDTIIVGGGPAAIAAGIYVGRKKMKTLLIADSFGGQSLVSDDIRNWIGVVSISGPALAKALTDHLMAQEGIEIKMPEKALSTKEIQDGFEVLTERGDAYQTRTLIIASGGRRRRLGVPGEDKFEGKGVAYCSICDAPLFKGKAVAVVGGGNAGFEAAIDLLPYATKIYILEFGAEPKADAITQAEVKKSPLVTVITNAQTKEVLGDNFVSGLKYIDRITNEEKLLEVGGVFVQIGSQSNSEIVKGLVDVNKYGEIMVDHKFATTSKPGIFAAGDVTDAAFKQNNIAVGDGIKAALSAYNYLLQYGKKNF